jgi:hypothetical protein
LASATFSAMLLPVTVGVAVERRQRLLQDDRKPTA